MYRKKRILNFLTNCEDWSALGYKADAIRVYMLWVCEEIICRLGDNENLTSKEKEYLIDALDYKVNALKGLSRYEQSIIVCDEIVHRFGNETDIELKQQVAEALYLKAFALFGLKRYKEALSNFINTYGNTEELSLKRKTALALLLKRK